MTYQELAPRTVFEACARGLKQFDRAKNLTTNHGGTGPAVTFADRVFNSRPVDAATASEVVEAHRTLDRLPRSPDGESPQVRLSRLLWGGDDAVDWANSILQQHRSLTAPQPETPAPSLADPWAPLPTAPGEPEPAPLAASVREDKAEANRALAGVGGDVIAIDQTTVESLRAAFWVSYRAAFRSLTGTAKARLRRVPKADQVSAGLEGNDLNDLRDLIGQEPLTGCRHLPDTLAAAIDFDFDQALTGTLDDYEATAAAILRNAQLEAANRITDRLKIDRSAVESLAPSADLAATAAAALRVELHDWIRDRFDRRDVSPSLQDEDLFSAPRRLFHQALGSASGEGTGGASASIGSALVTKVIGRVRSKQTVSLALTPAVEEGEVSQEWFWHYGDPATRRQPYPDHVALADKSWRNDTERAVQIGGARPGEHHPNCQCQILPRWRVE